MTKTHLKSSNLVIILAGGKQGRTKCVQNEGFGRQAMIFALAGLI